MRTSEIIELWRNKKGGKVNKRLCLEMEMASLPSISRFRQILPFGRRRILIPESSEKFRAPGENQTHDPQSSSSDARTTELLEALWREGSKFHYNYTSHRRLYRGRA